VSCDNSVTFCGGLLTRFCFVNFTLDVGKISQLKVFSSDRSDLSPVVKSSVSQQQVMDRPEMVTAHSEHILNRSMDKQEALNFPHGSKTSRLTFSMARWLMRSLNSVILILPGSVFNGWKDFAMGSWITPELVGIQFPRWATTALQQFAKEPFRRSLIPLFGHKDVKGVAILIDSPPQVVTLT